MNRQESADKYFDAIMELHGVNELKRTVERLRLFQQNRERYSVSDVTLPNYLWTIKRGGGVTTCVSAFAEYLYAAKIIEFTGIVKYFEFIPVYMSPDEYFSELTRLNNTVSEIAGHYSYFRGIACIILDEWIDNTSEANFLNIFDYIANHNDKILAIFCVHTDDKNTVDSIESAISTYMRVETMALDFPNADKLVELMETKSFNARNFYLDNEAKILLKESIEDILTGKNFNGFVTIKQIANDILYSLLTSNLSGNNISAEMLSNFNKDSEYIKRIKNKVEKRKIKSITGFKHKEESK